MKSRNGRQGGSKRRLCCTYPNIPTYRYLTTCAGKRRTVLPVKTANKDERKRQKGPW